MKIGSHTLNVTDLGTCQVWEGMVCTCTRRLSGFIHVQFCATPWTIAHQAHLSVGISRPEYWHGLPCLSPGGLPNPGIERPSLPWQVVSLPTESPGKP